ncbi:major facilitator superfamily domain-containing protein [Podospora conica]|nr:major facilitator superfamily domain-containing protein [Schizothecium conicum]
MSATDEKKSALPVDGIAPDTPVRTSRSDNEELGVKETSDLVVVCPAHTTDAKILRRIDWHIIPAVSVLYVLAFLDRVNIGNARSFSLAEDLGLKGNQFNTALTIFFIPYVLFEIPSNVLLKKWSPRIWLSACCIGFGLITVFQGFVQNFAGILVTRFLLGVFECGMFPGCFYLISMWYKRSEAQKRYSFFFSSTSLAGAFGGLLASAIGKMDGVRNYSGWRWIFILEGLITVVFGILFLFTFPSFPEESKWLTPEELVYVKARLRADQGDNGADSKMKWSDVVTVMKDYKIWLGGFMYFGMIVPAYGFAYFAPTIVGTYKYSAIKTQLYTVPPWAAAFVFAMVVATASDATRHRFLYTFIPICISISGLVILMLVHNNLPLQYGALFLTAMGCYSAMPVIVCWFSMNLGGHRRRAVGTAWQIGFGNIGGIISTYSFMAADAPRYKKGYALGMGFLGLAAVSCVLYAIALVWENKKKEKTLREQPPLTDEEKKYLGDLNPEFKYML